MMNTPSLFKLLVKGTVHRWLAKDAGKHALKKWSKTTKASVKRMRALPAFGHAGVLVRYPEIVTIIVDKLHVLRTSGLAVNVFIAHSIILTVVGEKTPELLVDFKASEVGPFLTIWQAQSIKFIVMDLCAQISTNPAQLEPVQGHQCRCSRSP